MAHAVNTVVDPTSGNAQVRVTTKKSDDFDMAKLQKQLRHEQRRSAKSNYKAAKLSPAEIRSLNYNDLNASRPGASRPTHRRPAKIAASTTPPSTPDNASSNYGSQRGSGHASAADVATAPISPSQQRRGSNASSRIIHAPQPISHAQLASFSTAPPTTSRPVSQSSYRGIATYRGPEVTRSGSLTMFQRPSPDIVSNPLSNFSRPRQSTVTSSPEKATSSRRPSGDSAADPILPLVRAQTMDAVSRTTSRQHSPVRRSDSPVSMDERRPVERAVPRSPPVVNGDGPAMQISPKALPRIPTDDLTEPSARQKLNWRKTLTGSSAKDPEMTPLRKEFKRRTFVLPRAGQCLHAVNYADTKAGQPPQLRDTLKNELPSIKTSVFKNEDNARQSISSEFNSHPAVRPLSHDGEQSVDTTPDSSTSASQKGKEREVESIVDPDGHSPDSIPAYSRCDCCGRIVNPGGYASDLSPVLETENPRSNLDSQVEQMQPEHRRRSSSYESRNPQFQSGSSRGGSYSYQQIRLMEYEKSPVPQKNPAFSGGMPPRPVVLAMNKPGDIIGPGSMPLAIMPPPKTAPRFTRFGSLHAKKDVSLQENEQEIKGGPLENPNVPAISRFGSLRGLRDQYKDSPAQLPSESQSVQQMQVQTQQFPLLPSSSLTPQMSAYQAQQMRQTSPSSAHSQSNYHSANSSHQSLATPRSKLSQEVYRDNEASTTQPPPLPTARQVLKSSNVRNATTLGSGEDHLSRSVPVQMPHPLQAFTMPESDGGEGPMIDLSSVDGHFVQQSITSSATAMANISPPTSSHGPSQNVSPLRPARIDTSVASIISPDTKSEYTPASIPSSTQSHPQPPSYHTATTGPRAVTEGEKLNSAPTQALNNDLMTKPYSTTVVRLIPSPVIGSGSSSPISANNKGQLKLGDWVLPESPKPDNQSMNSNRTNLAQSGGVSKNQNGANSRVGVTV